MKIKAISSFERVDLLEDDTNIVVGKTYNTTKIKFNDIGKGQILISFSLKETDQNKIVKFWSSKHFDFKEKDLEKEKKNFIMEKL